MLFTALVVLSPLGFVAPAQDPSALTSRPAALSLSLDEACRIALESNLGLRIEEANTEAALFNYRATWGSFDWVLGSRVAYTDSELQPRTQAEVDKQKLQELSIDLTRPCAATGGTFRTSFSSTESRLELGGSNPFFNQDVSTTDVLSLQYTQPLLRGAWREYATSRNRESELESRQAEERLREKRRTLLLAVHVAYWNLVAARDALAVAESSVELARSQVDQNQRRLDAGTGTSVEIVQAEAALATREETRLKADVDARKAADDLKLLLVPGRDTSLWDADVTPSTALPEAADGSLVPEWGSAFARAVERRPELRQQRFSIDAAAVRHARAKNERKAGLDLDLSASSQGFDSHTLDALETTAQFDFPTYRAALVFNYALGNTSASNLERAAWAQLRGARLAYDEIETRVAAEVRDGVRQVLYQSEAVRAADKSLELARRQLAAEELRLENQLSTTFEVLKFQVDLAQAMSTARRARADLAKARASLLAAQGLLGDAGGNG